MQPPSPRLPALRTMEASTAGERETLEAFLDFYRDVLIHKVRGVGDQEARRRLLPSLTTLAGLVQHLTVVERNWFHRLPDDSPDASPAGEDDESWVVAGTNTLDALLAEYDQACAVSRTTTARFALDDEFSHPHLGRGHCAGSTSTSLRRRPGTPATPTSSGN